MQKLTRTQAAAKNIKSSLLGIIINFGLSFFSRRIFVLTLGKEYVGLGSLLGNVITVLSLFDLGASSALVYCLYRPLAEKNKKLVSEYLVLYNKICMTSSVLTFLAGIFTMPHLKTLVSDIPEGNDIYVIYLIYILSNSLSYLYSSKKILLYADQKSYVTQFFSYFFGVTTVIAESAVLLFTGNYILYLVCHMLLQNTEDICLSLYVKKIYPDIETSGHYRSSEKIRKQLFREMLLLQPSNVANTLLRTVDNFLIVHLFGIAANGVYSNYNLLLSYASMLSVTLMSAISSTVGNLGASETPERAKRIFFVTNYISFCLICVCATELCVLSGDFISVWLGGGMRLSPAVSCTLAALFFVSGMRRSTLVFRDAYGLYKKEKIKPFWELLLSVLFSVVFGKKIGISGIYLGQLTASVLVCLWYEPYILFKYCFGKGLMRHYGHLLAYAFVTALSCACSFSLCRLFDSLIIRVVICAVVSALFSFGAFFGSAEFYDSLEYLSGFFGSSVSAKEKVGDK